MTKQELAKLLAKVNPTPTISISELPQGFEGTLLYGYNCDRTTVHVYVKDNTIHSVTYNTDKELLKYAKGDNLYAGSCIPDKRVYRQPTHFFFMELLAEKGFTPSVTESSLPEDYSIQAGEFLTGAKFFEELNIIPSLA